MSGFWAALGIEGHWAYVWTAYGITLFVLVLNGWSAVRRHKRALAAARNAEAPARPARRPTVREL